MRRPVVYRVRLGAYWLQGECGWGPEACANEYATEREARKAARHWEGAEVLGVSVEFKEEGP